MTSLFFYGKLVSDKLYFIDNQFLWGELFVSCCGKDSNKITFSFSSAKSTDDRAPNFVDSCQMKLQDKPSLKNVFMLVHRLIWVISTSS